MAEVKLHLRLREAQGWPGLHYINRKCGGPTLQGHAFATAEGLVDVLLHNPHAALIGAR
jgi:hypothetical protein